MQELTTGWQLPSALTTMWRFPRKAVWFLGVAIIAFVGAVIYDHYRIENKPPPVYVSNLREVSIVNPADLTNPDQTRLGEITGSIDSSQLFEEFRKDEKKARETYIGKTYLITGRTAEIFEAEVSASPGVWGPNPFTMERVTPGIMLAPNIDYIINDLSIYRGITSLDELYLPRLISVQMDPEAYETRYAKELRKKENWTDFDWFKPHRRVFWHYSDDFSFRSYFGGVYCMFQDSYHAHYYGFPEMKTWVAAKCKIIDYKQGGIEQIDLYKLRQAKDPKVNTEPRVIAIGCVETNYEMSKD